MQSENLALDHRFPYAGGIFNGSLHFVGSEGRYWSRTVYASNSYGAHYLRFINTSVGVQPRISTDPHDSRYAGYPIRCVAAT